MSNYLVVAHQTAESPELLEKMQEIAREDASARFTLVVPITRVNHLLTYTDGEANAVAWQAGNDARQQMQRAGLNVVGVRPGDESPLQAIADEMAGDTRYDAIVISTLPPGLSRWLKLDVHARARQKFDVPVISVVANRSPAVAGSPQ